MTPSLLNNFDTAVPSPLSTLFIKVSLNNPYHQSESKAKKMREMVEGYKFSRLKRVLCLDEQSSVVHHLSSPTGFPHFNHPQHSILQSQAMEVVITYSPTQILALL
jgi:hypothetical protein